MILRLTFSRYKMKLENEMRKNIVNMITVTKYFCLFIFLIFTFVGCANPLTTRKIRNPIILKHNPEMVDNDPDGYIDFIHKNDGQYGNLYYITRGKSPGALVRVRSHLGQVTKIIGRSGKPIYAESNLGILGDIEFALKREFWPDWSNKEQLDILKDFKNGNVQKTKLKQDPRIITSKPGHYITRVVENPGVHYYTIAYNGVFGFRPFTFSDPIDDPISYGHLVKTFEVEVFEGMITPVEIPTQCRYDTNGFYLQYPITIKKSIPFLGSKEIPSSYSIDKQKLKELDMHEKIARKLSKKQAKEARRLKKPTSHLHTGPIDAHYFFIKTNEQKIVKDKP